MRTRGCRAFDDTPLGVSRPIALVRIADRLDECGYIELSEEAGAVTETGLVFLDDFGVDTDAGARSGTRVFCRPCLDWSERVLHIGGTLGAALAARCFALGW